MNINTLKIELKQIININKLFMVKVENQPIIDINEAFGNIDTFNLLLKEGKAFNDLLKAVFIIGAKADFYICLAAEFNFIIKQSKTLELYNAFKGECK